MYELFNFAELIIGFDNSILDVFFFEHHFELIASLLVLVYHLLTHVNLDVQRLVWQLLARMLLLQWYIHLIVLQ